MPPPPLPTKITPTAVATAAVPTSSSSSSSTAQQATPVSDNSNSPTSSAGRKIRNTSSYNYTKPIIRLNLKNLNPKTVTSTTTSSPSFAPTTSVRHQAPMVQVASHSVSYPLPVASDLSQTSLTSTSKQTKSPKTTQPVVITVKSSNSADSSNGSKSSNISLPPDYDSDLSDEAGTTDEPDHDSGLRHRRRHTQPQLACSPSLPHPPPLPKKQQTQAQEPEITCSVDGEDPFKELGLKPYSPIWLPSRTPSFELMRQRSYSPNPRHGMTILPSQVQDGDDVIGKNDRDILGFDLHEPLKEEDKPNKKNLTTTDGKERQEPGSNHRYERFGSIKKRPSPLLPDHYDDLEDHDAEEVNLPMVDGKKNCMSTTKRTRRDHASDQSQVPLPPPLFPHANNSNLSSNHARAESGKIVEGPARTHHNGQNSSPPLWSNNNSNHGHSYRQQPYGSQWFPPSQHRPHSHPHHQPYHHRRHLQQHEPFENNNYSYNHHHHNHQINRPYQSRPWTSYRRNNYQHPGGFNHTRVGFHAGNGDNGDEGSNWFHHERALLDQRRGRGRSFGRGRGRGRGGYGNAEFYNRYHFPPRQGGSHGMDPYHQHHYQHHFEDEGPMTEARPLEIANGASTGIGTVTVIEPPFLSPPLPSPPRGHITDPHSPPPSSSLSIASSSRNTLHLSPNLNHHIYASAQKNEKHSQISSNNNTESPTPPLPLPSAPSSSAETKTTVALLSKSTTSTTTALPYSFSSSLRTPSPPPQPVFISHHTASPHNSISPSKSFSKSLSKSFSRSFSRSLSRSRSRSPSPATLSSSAQTRLTRYAASEISSLAQNLTTEQTLRVQAQKQIRFLTQSLRVLEERNQRVEQNYEALLARYNREVRK